MTSAPDSLPKASIVPTPRPSWREAWTVYLQPRVLIVLLLITIIGIPLALIVLLLYLLLLFLGWVTAALFLSHKLLGVMRGGQPVSTAWRLFALLLGVLGLWLLGQLPYVGGWVSFAALLLGIGALVWQGWPSRTAPVPPVAA